MNEKIHHGRNIKRFREMMGIKQEALAHELGEDYTLSLHDALPIWKSVV